LLAKCADGLPAPQILPFLRRSTEVIFHHLQDEGLGTATVPQLAAVLHALGGLGVPHARVYPLVRLACGLLERRASTMSVTCVPAATACMLG
jgi:hypothetical protein